MTVKIAFIDPTKGDYTPETPRHQPLGGSQSALCYLGEVLAAAGHSITLVNGTRAVVTARGVRCLPIASVSLEDLCAFDVVVILNGCDGELLRRLRATLGGERTLILWTQHAADQPAVANLAEAELRDCLDGIAFVSRWQMDGYLKSFRLDPARCRVMRNGIAPAFADLFGPDEDVLAAKPWPPVLAYTSVPFRGLDVLLDSLPLIRAAIPGTRLRVCSSLEAYQVSDGRDPYTALYQRCRETEGVEYLGGLGQEALAEVLREATCLAYLNRFAETSCIAVLEALAAGCLVVSSQLGALPESGAGFARLMPVPENPQVHALRYAEAAVAALTELREDPGAARRLRAQIDHANAETAWAVRAQGWIGWLEDLREPVPVGAATAITAKIVSAQQQLMEALGTHLNSGGDRRFADPAWRAEARGMIELVERSLRLDHNDEEARTGVWSALRGYEAWLSYHTALPELPPPSPLPPGGRRIFDCFQFYNELDLLEVRLAELYLVVDRFVLVEATYTHAGAAKPLYYADNRARFAAYADKIVHIVVAEDPGGFAWNREAYQRDAILRGLGECRPSDMILISDADEILRAPVVERLRWESDGGAGMGAGMGATLFAPHLDIFLYFLDLKAPDPWVSVAAAALGADPPHRRQPRPLSGQTGDRAGCSRRRLAFHLDGRRRPFPREAGGLCPPRDDGRLRPRSADQPSSARPLLRHPPALTTALCPACGRAFGACPSTGAIRPASRKRSPASAISAGSPRRRNPRRIRCSRRAGRGRGAGTARRPRRSGAGRRPSIPPTSRPSTRLPSGGSRGTRRPRRSSPCAVAPGWIPREASTFSSSPTACSCSAGTRRAQRS